MTAIIGRIGFEVDALDVFCGFGGSSQGIHAAGATVRAAANHSELAIECHSANFPETDHWQVDLVDPVNPEVINRAGKKVPGRYLDPAHLPRARYAWFSPSCRHHSQANAKKIYRQGRQLSIYEDEDWDEERYANSERSRVTMSCVLRYVAARLPEIVAVENVLEVTKWGPGQDGSTFKWWMTELRNLGYEIQICFFNSMFWAPCPQSRDRIYIVAHRRGNRAPDLEYRPTAYCTSDRCGGRLVEAVQTWKPRTAAWMLDTWGKYLAQYDYRCPDCRSVVHPASWMALSAIDWSNLGPTLEERITAGKRPADTTWERIRRAVAKYRNAPPVLLPGPTQAETLHVAHGESISTSNTGSADRHAGNRSRSVSEHLPTLAQRNTIAEAGYRAHHVAEPLGSIVGSSRPQSVLALVVPGRKTSRPLHGAEALPSMLTHGHDAVVLAAAGNTSERPGQTRARPVADALFTQSTTNEFAVAALPALRGDHTQESHASESVATLAASGNHQAIVTALFTKINGGADDTAWHGVDEALNTVTGRDTHGLVVVPWIDQWLSDPVYVTEQLATITARMRHTLASIEPSEEPITDEMLMQVRFRMLQPDPELRRAMAFADEYILLGNKTEMTAGLGNAVTPPVASWISQRCLATLQDEPTSRRKKKTA